MKPRQNLVFAPGAPVRINTVFERKKIGMIDPMFYVYLWVCARLYDYVGRCIMEKEWL